MYTDSHLHCAFSGDSDTPPRMQIERAVTLGMKRICFTDHHDYDVKSDIDFNLDIPAYFEEIKRLRDEYADKIDVGIGVELGLQVHISEYLEKLAGEYPFDFIIGSVHFIDGLDPYYPEYFELHGKASYERYFETVLDCIKKIGCFDSLGHLDYIVRYGTKHGMNYSYAMYADYIDEILKRIIGMGKALECNTGGFAAGLGEPNPCADILRRYRSMGGELITLGSDAHTPDRLGYEFERCGELLKNCGFRYYAVYRNRVPEMKML